MKKYIYTTIFLLISALSVQATNKWELTENKYEVTINDRSYPLILKKMKDIDGTIYAINNSGRISGVSFDASNIHNDWQLCFLTPMPQINYNPKLYNLVINNGKIFFPSDSGVIYQSFDRGKTWDSTYLGDEFKHPIKHLKFVNDSVGFMGHTHKYGFLKTTDGGQTWNPLPPVNGQMPEVFALLNFVPIDENTIYLVGRWTDGYHFYYTDNGGLKWYKLEVEPFEGFPQVPAEYNHLEYINNHFIVEKRYKPGPMGSVSLMTSKDFINWEPLFISDTISGGKFIFDVQYFDDLAIGTGKNTFIISNDNGESWVDLYDESDEFYSRNNPVSTFAYIDGYVYAPGTILEKGDDGLMHSIRKLYRYKLDIQASVETELTNLSVYPNPTQSEVNITYEKELESIEVIDINGRSMMSLNGLNLAYEKSINVDALSTGTYFIRINNKIYKRFVKE